MIVITLSELLTIFAMAIILIVLVGMWLFIKAGEKWHGFREFLWKRKFRKIEERVKANIEKSRVVK